MASDFFKVKKGLNLDSTQTSAVSAKGDVAYNSATDKLELHNGAVDPLVSETKTATLTNKVLSGNTATSLISGSGTLTLNTSGTVTLPNATDTLVGKATTDTLTNKTLTGNTAVNLVSGSGTLTLNTSGTVTLPNATDTLVGKATTDTLTNKTLTSPTINTPTITGSGGTLTLPAGPDTLVGRATTDTLTNKTLSGNTAATLISGSGTLTLNTTGTITLPNATDTLVGKATTDTLTNKTIGDAATYTQVSTPSNPSSGFDRLYFKSDDNLYKLNSAGVETKIGAGSAAGINYISNSDAESATTGWATYADAAGNIPVDGTGGTATNLTFSRSTSSPLRGAASFSMAQANSTSLQGKGVSYDFTVDAADKAKPLAISFDYNASSTFVASDGRTAPLNDGTTTTNAGNSDVEVFIYDVTNAALIPVSPQVIAANGSNNFTYKGEFQTASNSTSYRLIFHVATTSANATGWTFKFDNVSVGPQTQALGPAMTDWQSYTPTFTGFGTVTTVDFYYRRVGDSLEVQGRFVTGTNTAATALITLPSGLTVDTAKLTANSVVQSVGTMVADTAADNSPYSVLVGPGGFTTAMGFGRLQASLTALAGSSFVNSSSLSLFAKFPISGWSSTSVMSNDTDTRVVTSKATLGSASGTFTTGVIAKVPFNSITGGWDTHSGWDLTNNRYTAPVSGYYRITNTLCWSTSTGLKLTSYRVNGGSDNFIGTITGSDRINTSSEEYLKAGDYVEIWGRQDSGGNATLTSTGVANSYAIIERLSGPATIAASESVNCRYYSTSGDVLSSSTNANIKFPTKDYDTHGAYNSSTGTFTAPIAGKYRVVVSAAANTSSGTGNIRIKVNASTGRIPVDVWAPATSYNNGQPFGASGTASLSAGDTLTVNYDNQTGGSLTLQTGEANGSICIERVGN